MPKITEMLQRRNVPHRLAMTCINFLIDRQITTEDVTDETERGCPQGSSLGPILWLLVMKDWFDMTETLTTDIDLYQAYADDQIILLGGTSLKQLENKWTQTLNTCVSWATQNKLTYNTTKTEIMFSPYNNNTRLIDGTRTLELKEHVIYLELTIDNKLTYIEHIKRTRQKITDIANKLYAITGLNCDTCTSMG